MSRQERLRGRRIQMAKEATESHSDFRVLVAVGEQAQLSSLLTLSCTLARAQDGAVTVICVTIDGKRPDWLQVPERCGGVSVHTEVRAGTNAARVILEASRILRPNLLLLGWRGSPGQPSYLLGSTLDPVTRYAPCDVGVVRVGDLGEIRHALVPMSGGPNAPLAMELALSLDADIQVTALYVARESLGPMVEAAGHALLENLLEPWADDERVVPKVVHASGVIRGILAEAASGYDLVLVGASNESYIDRKLFGNVPQTVAENAFPPTIVVRHRAGPVKIWLRRAGERISSIHGELTEAQRIETYQSVRQGARARPDFFVLIGLAAAIATLGLWMDNPAVIIGAMVIAPLMSAILGISLGMTQGDGRMISHAVYTTLRGAGLAVLIGGLVSLVTPGRALTPEILGRTHPTLFDLGVALISGLAAAYAQCRRDSLSALSGVAIAVALVPPLATVGIGLTMFDGSIAGGASLLFLTNLSAIVTASSLVFLFFGFRPDPGERFRVFGRSVIGVVVLFLAVSVVLTVLTVSSIRLTLLSREIERVLDAETHVIEGVELDTWGVDDEDGATLRLYVRVRATGEVSRQEIIDMQERVAVRLGRPIALRLSVTPVTQLEPYVP